MIVGIIPARGGSKGVPKKNIRMVDGKPLLAYTIECAQQCGFLDAFIVSTDSQEIKEIAERYHASVPFLRPSELSQDATPTLPVLEHAVVFLEKVWNRTISTIVLLEPTAPLRTPEDIQTAHKLFSSEPLDAVISVNHAHRNPYFNMVKRDENGFLSCVLAAPGNIGRRQDAPLLYDLNPVCWIFSRNAVMIQKCRIPEKSKAYVVPAERAIDLDTEMDFMFLEYILASNRKAKTV